MAPGGAALVVTTLSLLAILLPASSAGLSPTASASASYTLLAFDASASPSPPMVSASPRTWSAEAAAPLPFVDQPFHDAASPPPPPVVDEPFRDATTSSPPPPPVVDEVYRDATTSPPPPPPVADEPFRDGTSPPPPSLVVADEAYRDAPTMPPPPPPPARPVVLQQIAKVLASLGYNEMASSAKLLADSTRVETWPGGAITVFGVPDVFLQHSYRAPDFSCSCSRSRRRHLLLHHMALGYYTYAELAAAPAIKLPSASIGFCLDVAAEPRRGRFSLHHAANLYVNGVIVSQPDLYDDGRYVVHGLHGFIPPLSHASCDDAHAHHHHHQVHLHHHHHHHRSARSAARIMIREAISRLHDRGFGFVALAMRFKFPELEKLSNLTVFALNDQAIFSGGGHGYVSALRFHIVPGHRLTRADLLLLRPGTLLPTLAGEDQKLAITLRLGSTDEVRINYVAVKEPDLVINSRVAVHGIYLPFPRLPFSARGHHANGWERDYHPTSTSSSHGQMILILSVVAAILAVLGKIVEIAVRIFAMLLVAE